MPKSYQTRENAAFNGNPAVVTVGPSAFDADYEIDAVTVEIVSPAGTSPAFSVRVIPSEYAGNSAYGADLLTDESPVTNETGRRVGYIGTERIGFNPAHDRIQVQARDFDGGVAAVIIRLKPIPKPPVAPGAEPGGFPRPQGFRTTAQVRTTPVGE